MGAVFGFCTLKIGGGYQATLRTPRRAVNLAPPLLVKVMVMACLGVTCLCVLERLHWKISVGQAPSPFRLKPGG